MTRYTLAKIINTRVGWVTRALRGDANAKGVRYRLAGALSWKCAKQLGLGLEWEVEERRRELKRAFEATL